MKLKRNSFLLANTAAAIACCAFCTALCGCNSSDRPSLGTVHGHVTLDGLPLPNANIGFAPSGPFRSSFALTDKQGDYELSYIRDIKGAAIGKNNVRVSTHNPLYNNVEKIPAKYNLQTILEADVKPGDNEFNFDLTTK